MKDFSSGSLELTGSITSALLKTPSGPHFETLTVEPIIGTGKTRIRRSDTATAVLGRGVYHISTKGSCGCHGLDVFVSCSMAPQPLKPESGGATRPATDGGTEPVPTCDPVTP